MLSFLRNCIFIDTCSILYFFDVLKSYDADSFISDNTVPTRDPRVTPYHRIQKMCVFVQFLFYFLCSGLQVVVGIHLRDEEKTKDPGNERFK